MTEATHRKSSQMGKEDVLQNGFQGYKEGYETLSQNKWMLKLRHVLQTTVFPLLLTLTTPNFVIILWYTAVHSEGSYSKMADVFQGRSILGGLLYMWGQVRPYNTLITAILVVYSFYALVTMKLIPGKTVYGPLTPKGNVPVYKDNGFAFFILTMVLFVVITAFLKQLGMTPTIIYDQFDTVLSTLNIFSLIFCLFLYVKGIVSPSSTDCGATGNFIFDYYWGTELYPRIFGYDIKVFTNCRFGLMVWALLVSIFALKSYELHGFVDSMFVCCTLQLVYLAKFFWWEAGYMRTIDIMLDRAGYYICWGCLVFVPGFYTSVSLYLVNQPVILGPWLTALFLTCGILSIYINYDADNQKQAVRGADGNCLIWGRKAEVIRAKYHLESGEERESILLASGWWGFSRHFHYIPEILLAFFWSVPALFVNIMPFSYTIFLIVLLIHRSYRDEAKCCQKYGTFWVEYCKRVPHKIVPYLF
ncbi:LOW QUALITY PROTEIN: 7-dehydrocholesterol reductase-like [Haliotis rubra]|uniref:LOW QUALITY PROTEIN: 7-dehydrocholesterol reductase-like n=1 Tax=Haliotis rubra TaxID=36100 RepID=UPI001EE6238E|nr:LOW QUALITY PROTEIN: 7-dehydrocholesterol reductase-like [Haliotis rubra]